MAQYSGVWTLGQVSQAVKAQNWTGIAPPNIEYLVVAGGGGGAGGSTNVTSGNGGSGIVIIRYPANCAPPASTTGLQQVLYNNGYQIYVWTSSGTITF